MNINIPAVIAAWYNNRELNLANYAVHQLQCVKLIPDIRYTDTGWMFFVTPYLRDNRDLSTYRRPKLIIQSRFFNRLNRWLKKHDIIGDLNGVHFSKAEALENVKAIARELWRSLDTDLSLTMLELSHIDTPDSWKMILSTSIDPSSTYYTEAGSDLFLRDYQAVSFLRKFEGFTFDDVDPEINAVKVWLQAERKCRETNQRFVDMDFCKEELRVLFVIRKTIQHILGPSPSIAEIREHLRFGPGASASCPSGFTSILDKLDHATTVSTRSASIIGRILESTPLEGLIPRLMVSPCTRVGFVPKRWNVHRPIEVPEDIDVTCQLSLGTLIRKRLKKFGLDLDTQADRNGELAREGSQFGTYMTEDLQSASDTIAYELVRFLLPTGWFNILSRFRSPIVELTSEKYGKKETIHYRLNKFSAMGNGFTFELESLIFLAITLTSGGPQYSYRKSMPKDIGIFGDDIVCPTSFRYDLEYNLDLCGFTPNEEKSFSTGKFRESCGQDFFAGAPVRPYFQKKELTDVTTLYVLANGLRRVSVRSMFYYASDIRYRNIWSTVVHLIPSEYRVFGPESLGDSVIWANPEDGISGEWPIHTNQSWTYRTGPATLIQRGINLFAYAGSTLIHGWGLVKGGFVSEPFNNKSPSVLRKMARSSKYELKTASLVPRTFRRNSYRSRFKRSTYVFSIKYDCPAFQ